jgi:signal transduction histidine kinase
MDCAKTASAAVGNEAALTFLLVEDKLPDVRSLREHTREPGFPPAELVRVATVAAAVEAVGARRYDAVLVDLALPDAHGVDAVTRVRAAAPDVPIVALAGSDDEAEPAHALQAGAQDCLPKSEVTPALLARALRCIVERRRADAAEQREQAAARSDEVRERFLGLLSHDLRGPLNSIVMNIGLLVQRGALEERQLKNADRITRSAERMTRMVADLTSFARARESRGLELQRRPGDLADVCERVVEELAAGHPGRIVRLSAAGPGAGSWDLERIAQAVSALIENGLQESPPDAAVSVSIADRDSDAVIEVHSPGAPLPADALPTLFDPYARARAADVHKPKGDGLGLGLYLAHQIVLAHGGHIEVRSTAADGTTFRMILPRAPD